MSTLNLNLLSVSPEDGPQLEGFIAAFDSVAGSAGIEISFDGYGTYAGGSGDCPIYIENRGGVPHVIVWGDVNQEDPTHVISLAGAKVQEE